MESKRFDDIARRFARMTTRRAVIAAVVAAGAGVIASAGNSVGAARVCRAAGASCTTRTHCCNGVCPTGKAVPRAQRNRCPCVAGSIWCTSSCQSMNQPAHCGGCNQACPAGWTCPAGECCLANGDQCSADADCCIGSCDAGSGVCCISTGDACTVDRDCCVGNCDAGSGVCCISTGDACTVDGDCCVGNCDAGSGVCCISTGDACTLDGDCCSGICDAFSGTCIAVLLPLGAQCVSGDDCVTSFCAEGACCQGPGVVVASLDDCCSGTGTPDYINSTCD